MKDIKKVFLLVLVAMFSATTYAQTLEDDLKIQIPDKYYKTAKNHRDAILDAVSYEWNGAIQYLNFSDLPPVGDAELKYVVTNDDISSNNGYYTWTGVDYIKASELVSSVIGKDNNNAVKGNVINRSLIKKANGVNLFNKYDEDILNGYYISSLGNIKTNATYSISGFINVEEGVEYIRNGGYGGSVYLAFYDENFNSILSPVNSQIVTIPSGVEYVRSTYISADVDEYQFEQGGNVTTYSEYTNHYNLIGTQDLKDTSIIENKTIFFNTSSNLFDKEDQGVELNHYISYLDGDIVSNDTYNATGFIPVNGGLDYTMSYKHQIAWYDLDENYISGSNSVDTNKTQTAPLNAAYIRCTVNFLKWEEFQINEGDSLDYFTLSGSTLKEKYVERSNIENDLNKVETILGKEGVRVKSSSLLTGESLESDLFPLHLKKGIALSFYCEFSSLIGSVQFGKGYTDYRGEWFEIDATNVYYYFDGVLTDTQAHGRTIDTMLRCFYSVGDDGIANFVIQSVDGRYTELDFQLEYEMHGKAFIRSVGQTITNVQLSCSSKEFQHPVWAFGDSYFGVISNRWPGVMKDFGYFNFLIDGRPGHHSTEAYSDLELCLNFGTPKYLMWCLGMNDDDDEYVEILKNVISTCYDNDITLILATIPTVPDRDKENIKTIVTSSGYRYIDFYKAVGADASGNWYSGLLYTDEVHPTTLGAQALASQVLVDFPELMQYGKTF